jgi:hypothetical protein
MIDFYSQHLLARHVSDLTGPSSEAMFYELYVQIWYVVIRVLFDTQCPAVTVFGLSTRTVVL